MLLLITNRKLWRVSKFVDDKSTWNYLSLSAKEIYQLNVKASMLDGKLQQKIKN